LDKLVRLQFGLKKISYVCYLTLDKFNNDDFNTMSCSAQCTCEQQESSAA